MEKSQLITSEAGSPLERGRGVFPITDNHSQEANGKRNPAMAVPAIAFISSLRCEDIGSIRARINT
jgi:hypothetical protein